MKKVLFFLLYCLSIWLIAQSLTGKIIGAHDGDTITVRTDAGENIKVRLNGIDCPESGQDFGKRAKDFTWNFCYGKTLRVMVVTKDKYDRVVADVFANGQSLNRALVSAGLAWHFKKYSNDADLASLEDQARASGVGLWSVPNPMPPWVYRRRGELEPVGKLQANEVMICNSKSSKTYHNKVCQGLSRCGKGISKVSKANAISSGRSPCGYCF
jgi:endonuclease YncB( thermonuclease family)